MTLNIHTKSATIRIILSLVTVLSCQLAIGQDSLKSTMEGGNHCTGNYFDISAKSNLVRLSGFGLHLAPGKHNIKLYTKANSYVGSETHAPHWDLYTEKTLKSKGENTVTRLSFTELNLNPMETMGFALVSDSMVLYSNATGTNEFHENNDLSVYANDAICGETFSKVQQHRVWNGLVYYNDQHCFVMVPENKNVFQICL